MTKKELKREIIRWMDLQILALESKCVMFGKLELNNIEFTNGKKIHIADPHKLAEVLGAEFLWEKRTITNSDYKYEGYFEYRGYRMFGMYTEKDFKRVNKM